MEDENDKDAVIFTSLVIAVPCIAVMTVTIVMVTVTVACYRYRKSKKWSPPISKEPLAKSRVNLKRRPSDVFFVDDKPFGDKPTVRRKISTSTGNVGFIDAVVEPYISQSPMGGSLLEIPENGIVTKELNNLPEEECEFPPMHSLLSLNSVPAVPPPDYAEIDKLNQQCVRESTHVGPALTTGGHFDPGYAEIDVMSTNVEVPLVKVSSCGTPTTSAQLSDSAEHIYAEVIKPKKKKMNSVMPKPASTDVVQDSRDPADGRNMVFWGFTEETERQDDKTDVGNYGCVKGDIDQLTESPSDATCNGYAEINVNRAIEPIKSSIHGYAEIDVDQMTESAVSTSSHGYAEINVDQMVDPSVKTSNHGYAEIDLDRVVDKAVKRSDHRYTEIDIDCMAKGAHKLSSNHSPTPVM